MKQNIITLTICILCMYGCSQLASNKPSGVITITQMADSSEDGRPMFVLTTKDGVKYTHMYAEEIAQGLLDGGNYSANEDLRLYPKSDYQVNIGADSILLSDGYRNVATLSYTQIGKLNDVFIGDNE